MIERRAVLSATHTAVLALALAGCAGGRIIHHVDSTDDAGAVPLDADHATDAMAMDADGGDHGLDAGSDAGSGEADAGSDAGVATPSTPMAAGDVVISEIHAAPAGYADDSLAEWVEIHNPSATVTYNLNGCVFSDKPADNDHTFTEDILLPPGGYVVVSSAPFTVLTHGFVSDAVYGATGTGLSGTADAPTIKCATVVIDTVSYSMANGFPVPDDMEGHSLSLDTDSLSSSANDLGANWCFSTLEFLNTGTAVNYGTPRAVNAACP